MKPKHKRLIIVGGLFVLMLVAAGIILSVFKEHAVFFVTPKDLIAAREEAKAHRAGAKQYRLGGLVKAGSVLSKESGGLSFVITDHTAEITVEYQGLVPSLFREGQGVVAQGSFNEAGIFKAQTLLAKHDEYYMPPEVVKALKASGHWQHEAGAPDVGSVEPKAVVP